MRTLPVLLLVCGCGLGPTRGELGKAQFSYDDGAFGCSSLCGVDEPLAARSSATLLVLNPAELPVFTASSSDDSMAKVTLGGTSTLNGKQRRIVSVSTLRAGAVKLVLNEMETGGEVDRLALDVQDVQGIQLKDSGLYAKKLTVMTQGEVDVAFTVRDGQRRVLRGAGGLDYAFSGGVNAAGVTLASALSEIFSSIFVGTGREHVVIRATAAGEGTLTASSPAGATLEVPVAVVDASAVERVTLEGESSPALNDDTTIGAEAFLGDGEEVHAPTCAWAVSPEDAVTQVSSGKSSLTLRAASATTVTVTCDIGSAHAERSVTFR